MRKMANRRSKASSQFAAAKKWLRETAEPQQFRKPIGVFNSRLGNSEGMQPQQVIAPLQGVAAEAEQLRPAAAGDKDALRLRAGVVQPFEEVPPTAVFVQLVEYPQVGGGQLPTQDALPMGGDVPIQIASSGVRQVSRQGRLADLTGPAANTILRSRSRTICASR